MLPIENSIGGSIHRNYDLLVAHELPIVGEVELPVIHHLLALPGASLERLRRVYSHPQALAQCEKFLRTLKGIDIIATYDTAGSAKMVADEKLADAAAIASARAGEVFGLTALAASVQDFDDNITRFLVVGRQPLGDAVPDKTSIVFTLPNEPGSLFKALSVFALRGVDLTKLESRPIQGRPWEYLFYVDLAAARDEVHCTRALAHLAEFAPMLRTLGSYASWKTHEPANRPTRSRWPHVNERNPLTTGASRAPARAMLKAVGFNDSDLEKPLIGVANTWIEIGPCNYHLRDLAVHVKDGIRAAGGTPMEFNTVSISDGITMGTEGMRASLISREVIADSIELVTRGNGFDGLIVLVGCDKTIPGGVMALARLNVPGLVLYGGSIAPGQFNGHSVTIQDVFEAVGAHAAGRMSDAELCGLEDVACPGAGACGGQFTANTMAIACEFLGIAPLGSGSVPATDPKKADVARAAGERVMSLVRSGLKPRDIMTRGALENAIVSVAATGGSTNAVLHLLAIAREAGVDLSLADFDRISARVPVIADLKPSGRFVATDLHAAGGSPLVAKRLVEAG